MDGIFVWCDMLWYVWLLERPAEWKDSYNVSHITPIQFLQWHTLHSNVQWDVYTTCRRISRNIRMVSVGNARQCLMPVFLLMPQFKGLKYKFLVDIDECVEDPEICALGTCSNTPGSFICLCPEGFIVSSTGKRCQGKLVYYLQLVFCLEAHFLVQLVDSAIPLSWRKFVPCVF